MPHERESTIASSVSRRARELLSVSVAVLDSVACRVLAKLFAEFAQRSVAPGGNVFDVSPNTLTDDSLPLPIRFRSFQPERSSAQSSSFRISMKSSEVVSPEVWTVRIKTFQEFSCASAISVRTKKALPSDIARRALCFI